MKTILNSVGIALFLALTIPTMAQTSHKEEKKEEGRIPAVRLISNADGTSTFERGYIPTLRHMNINTFWVNNTTEEWEKDTHKAPRKQYVITIKGKLRFKVSNGDTFDIEPGVVLLAEDISGEGHSWDMLDGSTYWERLYVPISDDQSDNFVKTK